MKRSRGFFYWFNFAINIIIAMQVGVHAGLLVIDLLKDAGAPPLVVCLTATLAVFASVVIASKALFRFDTWLDGWLASKRGRKYRIQILNIPRAWSIWLTDMNSPNRVALSEVKGHGIIGFGFFRIKHGDSLFQAYRSKHFKAYRFWRFSIEMGKR